MKRTIKKSATADSINLMEAFAEFIEEKEAQKKVQPRFTTISKALRSIVHLMNLTIIQA